jgi:hypothetical protein
MTADAAGESRRGNALGFDFARDPFRFPGEMFSRAHEHSLANELPRKKFFRGDDTVNPMN